MRARDLGAKQAHVQTNYLLRSSMAQESDTSSH
jgi:hypothetical protein